MSHTPGPWEVLQLAGPLDDWTGASLVVRAKEAPGGIAVIIGGAGGKYDAALIAAAPKLLAALKAWKEYEDGPSRFSWDDVQKLVDHALEQVGQ